MLITLRHPGIGLRSDQVVCFQNSNPVSADIIPQRQPYSEFSPTSTLPSIKIRSPSLSSSMSVRHLILWTTESFSSVSPLHTDSPVWRTHGWSHTSMAKHKSFMLATTTQPPSKVLYGVPQGSVLGPVLYVLYTSDVARLVEALGLGAHLYADNTQLYGHCSPANSFESCYYQLRQIRMVRHSYHQPSKLWSMPSSARESISPTAFSMGQVPTSLTVSNRS